MLPDQTPPERPVFRPRIQALTEPAPYQPRYYFLVAFFGGPIALAVVALQNLRRLGPNRGSLRTPTLQFLGLLAAATILFLLFSPAAWWSPTRNIRLAIQGISVLASLALTRLHERAALSMSVRHGDYTTTWKAIGWILAGGAVQVILTAIIGAARDIL